MRAKRYTPEMDAALVCPDGHAEVARRLGYTYESVRNRRRLLGITINTKQSAAAKLVWIASMDEIVRTHPVAAAAQKLQLAKGTVVSRRRELGITGTHRKLCPHCGGVI